MLASLLNPYPPPALYTLLDFMDFLHAPMLVDLVSTAPKP